MEYTIRDATEEDVPRLLEMQREIVKIHKQTWESELTVSEFKKELFGSNAVTNFKVCESGSDENKDLIGFISFFYGVSYPQGKMIYIEDIFVEGKFRSAGAGKALMKEAIIAARSKGCRKTMLRCANWNIRASNLYKSIGMEEDDSKTLSFDGETMKKFTTNRA